MTTIIEKIEVIVFNLLNENDIIGKYNNREGCKNLNNSNWNIDEVEESLVLSVNSVTIPLASDLAFTTLQVNELCCRGEVATTSVSNEIKKRMIHREIFVTINQKVNITMKNTVKGWYELKRKIKKGINNNLKIIFIEYAYERLFVNYVGAKRSSITVE